MGFFPTDAETLRYLPRPGACPTRSSGRALRARERPLPRRRDARPRVPGGPRARSRDRRAEPGRAEAPQDRIALRDMKALGAPTCASRSSSAGSSWTTRRWPAPVGSGWPTARTGSSSSSRRRRDRAITSCTNTSNPSVMLAAGLVAKKAASAGSRPSPGSRPRWRPARRWSPSTSTTPASPPYLEQVGFYTVGYGCTTCIGNSGPLPAPVVAAIEEGDLVAAAVLSGNRNFEGRINPYVKANYLASPPLVVAYALAGTVDVDPLTEPLTTTPTAPGVPARPVADDRRPHRRHGAGDEAGDLPAAVRRHRAIERRLERDPGQGRRAVRLGRRLHLHPGAAVLRRHGAGARTRSPRSRGRACSSRSATRSPPTTSARRARSPRQSPAGRT
jgi:hypothetical protein